jgi:RHS repeat-associated protein
VGFPNGILLALTITNTFSYNKRLQPINMSASAPSQTVFSIGYDFHFGNGNNGNVHNIYNYRDRNRDQSFTYDAWNRVISAWNAGTDCTRRTANNLIAYWGNDYTYDAWGNLTNKTIRQNPTASCAGELLNAAPANNLNQLPGYGHDIAGNMTSDPTDGISLHYDAENRADSATRSGVTTTFVYDADGNRVKKTTSGVTTLYWYLTPGIVGESDLSGTMKSEYVFFNGERVARRDLVAPTGVFYYFSDHLKTASVITDAAGVIKADSDYYPWGGELQFVNADSNHYKFTGKERDTETNLDYFGARYYSNGLGRFITPDWAAKPAAVPYAEYEDPQSLNLYTYVRNVPTTRFDADGHDVVLKGTKEEKQQEQQSIVANASAKGESELFKTQTDKSGATHLKLDTKAAAAFKGTHSEGYNKLIKAISSSKVATVSVSQTVVDPKSGKTVDVTKVGGGGATLIDKNGNAKVVLSPSGAGGMLQRPLPLQNGGLERLTPNSIIAGHELLGHALEGMLGHDHSEPAAIHVENQLRQEQGLPLRKEN